MQDCFIEASAGTLTILGGLIEDLKELNNKINALSYFEDKLDANDCAAHNDYKASRASLEVLIEEALSQARDIRDAVHAINTLAQLNSKTE